MTSKLGQQPRDAGTLEVFPDFPPRDDMQNSLHLDAPAHQAAITQHLGNYDTTIVLSEIPVRWTPSQTRGHRIPDLLVAFGVDRAQAIEQNGYSIRDLGKPPDFVLEVASESTRDNDIGDKRRDYANFGIQEYWRFDPTGNSRYDAPLAGDQLVDGEYRPIEIIEVEPDHLHGYSAGLNLHLCWDHGQLRWYDSATGQHLLTFAEEQEGRLAEREGRLAEREGRIAAERRAEVAEARLRELQEQHGRREG